MRPVVLRAVLMSSMLAAGTAGTLATLSAGPAERALQEAAPPSAGAQLAPEVRTAFEQAWSRQPRVDVNVPAEGARVVILKFNDYECPGCREAEELYHPILERLSAAHPGVIKYVVKDWPWNASCNFNVAKTIAGHEASCDAAAAARIARDHGKFDAMTAWLFAHQGASPEAVRQAATELLGLADFDKPYALKLPEIRSDIADGGVLGIASTPTYFINGVRVGLLQPVLFEFAIELEMNASR